MNPYFDRLHLQTQTKEKIIINIEATIFNNNK
jgi:hypothetical protein